MKTFTDEELKTVLAKHYDYVYGNDGGERANLRDADLRDADLRDANLCDANLRDANLCDANLCGANLCDADLRDANLRDADLCDANLCGANLCGANLRDADLRDADLRDADLRDANLCGANLCDAAGNRRQIRSLFISDVWPITYTAEYLQIGCQRHKIADWWGFDDKTIGSMESRALEWWQENRDFIKSAIEKYPATPTGKEGAAE